MARPREEEPTDRTIPVRIPTELAEQIDWFLKEGGLGYISRADVVRQAVAAHLEIMRRQWQERQEFQARAGVADAGEAKPPYHKPWPPRAGRQE